MKEFLWIVLLLFGIYALISYSTYNPIKDPSQFIKLNMLENNYSFIRQEVLSIADVNWVNYPLLPVHNQQLCLNTIKLLNSIPNINSAYFFKLKAHNKINNDKLDVEQNNRFIYNLCLGGRNEWMIDGQKIKQHPKTVVIFDAHYASSIINNFDEDCIMLCVDFNN
jgi:aspartyl/asparaginyl beta-hydroxylase (cupin superfamily)